MAKDLRYFLDMLRALGPDYYTQATRPVSVDCQATLLQQRLAQAKRFPVLYCPQVAGYDLPLVSGVFGSYELLGLALDLEPAQIKADPGAVLREYTARAAQPQPMTEVAASQAPVKEVVWQGGDVDLAKLPIPRQAPENPAPFVTVGMMISRDPDNGNHNLGVYRQQVLGSDRISCMIYPNHDGARIARRCAELGKPMEVVTVIGHHPTLGMAAVGHRGGAEQTDELAFAGGLLGESIEVTPGTTVDLPVPARAEIAIEGIIDPAETSQDGPFSEADGYYGKQKRSFVIQVKAITLRRDAIYHELDPVHPEHNIIGLLGREMRLAAALKETVPGFKAAHIGPENQTAKFLVYVSLEKQREDDVHRAALAALKFPFNYKVIVVDADVNVHDEAEVLWALATRVTRPEDIQVVSEGNPAKWVIDATVPLGQPFPQRVTYPAEMWQAVRLEDFIGDS